jgi:hypothetical protein
MSKYLEWDIDNPANRRLEVLEPERIHRVEITFRHHRRPPPEFLPIFVILVAALLLWRYAFGFLMLGALIGWQTIAMFLFAGAVIALLAWRDRRLV